MLFSIVHAWLLLTFLFSCRILLQMHKSRCRSIHTSFHKYLLLFVYIYRYICISNDQWKLYWPPGTSSSGPTQRKTACFFSLKCKPPNMFHHLHDSECQLWWWWREGLAVVVLGGFVCYGTSTE